MTDTTREQQTLLLNAALDGELDAAGTLDMEARLAADPELAAEYRRLVSLRDAIRARAPRDRAPDALRARVMAMAQPPISARPTAPRRPKFWDASYRALAASLLVGMLLGGGVVEQLASTARVDDVDRDVVAGFVRGRLSGQPVDVATSDRHTVKPWLAGKIAGATTVVDLKADGFPLVGGRVDVVGRDAGRHPDLPAARTSDRAERNAAWVGGRLGRIGASNPRRLFAARMERRGTTFHGRFRPAARRTRHFRRRVSPRRRRRARGAVKAMRPSA